MGAWGSGPFQNDSALDFVYEIQGTADLLRAFDWAAQDYIEVDEASSIVVAAECVAAMAGYPHSGLPDELAQLIATFPSPDSALIRKAASAQAATAAASELAELWAEGETDEHTASFRTEMEGLADRLAKAAS